jgi:hypothetical protein
MTVGFVSTVDQDIYSSRKSGQDGLLRCCADEAFKTNASVHVEGAIGRDGLRCSER